MSVNPFSLAGRRLLVTGASSGIGRQIAISCAEMGGTVVLTGRHGERLHDTLGHLAGSGHSAVAADLLETGAIDRVVAEAGALDGVVHAAGIARMVPFRMISHAHLDDVLGLNVHAPLLLTKKMRANVLSPGYVRTPLLDALGRNGAKIDELLDITPLGLGEPIDVAHAAVFLLSDASRWMTRSLFIADGGLTSRMSI